MAEMGSVHRRRGGELHLEEPINWRWGGVRREQRDGDRWRDDRWRQRESKRWEVIKLSPRLTAERSRNKHVKNTQNSIIVLYNTQCYCAAGELLKQTIMLTIEKRKQKQSMRAVSDDNTLVLWLHIWYNFKVHADSTTAQSWYQILILWHFMHTIGLYEFNIWHFKIYSSYGTCACMYVVF